MSRRIEIVEVGPRDGLQSEPDVLATPVKLELIAGSSMRACAASKSRAS